MSKPILGLCMGDRKHAPFGLDLCMYKWEWNVHSHGSVSMDLCMSMYSRTTGIQQVYSRLYSIGYRCVYKEKGDRVCIDLWYVLVWTIQHWL